MKCFAAQFLCPGKGQWLKKQVVCFDEEGVVRSIKPFDMEMASTVFLNGVLCPPFGLPGTQSLLNSIEASALLKRVAISYSQLRVDDFLDNYTNLPDLKIGSKSGLWCIEPVDLKNLFLLGKTTLYSVFP